MVDVNPKLDVSLQQALASLGDEEHLEVLLYPRDPQDALTRFLQDQKNDGHLDFNALPMAGCIVVKAPVKLIRKLAARDDVVRMAGNPPFTAH